MAGVQLTGLASGLDTGAVIDKLMASERNGPRARLLAQQSALQGRQRTLGDVATKLRALADAAQRLGSTTTWQDTQTLTSSDPVKVGARLVSGAGPGGYTVTVSRLATADQHTYAFTSPAAASTLTVGAASIAIQAGATVDDVIGAINAEPSAGVIALGVDLGGTGSKSLVLVARATGTAAAFTASGDMLSEDTTRARPARDAVFSVDGGPALTSSSNVVANAIPGVELTLASAPATATVDVGVPGVDKAGVTGAAQRFTEAYNAAVDTLRSALAGTPRGDHSLKAVLDTLRGTVSGGGVPGLSTGAPTGGASNPDSVAGKLVLDQTALSAQLGADPAALKALLTGDGLPAAVRRVLDPYTRTGGVLDARSDAAASGLRDLTKRLDTLDARLAARESQLRRQFTGMETALQRARSQNADLAMRLPYNR